MSLLVYRRLLFRCSSPVRFIYLCRGLYRRIERISRRQFSSFLIVSRLVVFHLKVPCFFITYTRNQANHTLWLENVQHTFGFSSTRITHEPIACSLCRYSSIRADLYYYTHPSRNMHMYVVDVRQAYSRLVLIHSHQHHSLSVSV